MTRKTTAYTKLKPAGSKPYAASEALTLLAVPLHAKSHQGTCRSRISGQTQRLTATMDETNTQLMVTHPVANWVQNAQGIVPWMSCQACIPEQLCSQQSSSSDVAQHTSQLWLRCSPQRSSSGRCHTLDALHSSCCPLMCEDAGDPGTIKATCHPTAFEALQVWNHDASAQQVLPLCTCSMTGAGNCRCSYIACADVYMLHQPIMQQ